MGGEILREEHYGLVENVRLNSMKSIHEVCIDNIKRKLYLPPVIHLTYNSVELQHCFTIILDNKRDNYCLRNAITIFHTSWV